MKTTVYSFATALMFATGLLQAHADHDHDNLPEEPAELHIPYDRTDVLTIPVDTSDFEDEEELDYLEELEKEHKAKKTAAPQN